MRRLLLLSCSQRKVPDSNLLPALIRYDGPPFRVLRRFISVHPAYPLDVFILSAKFGLIAAQHPIPLYDRRMTPERARELQPTVVSRFQAVLEAHRYECLYLGLGKQYLLALEGYTALLPDGIRVTSGYGSPGHRLASLHQWLYGGTAPARKVSSAPRPSHRPGIRGVKLDLTPAQAREQARRALRAGLRDNWHTYAWYVTVDDTPVPAKWLVSQLTGLPRHVFTTDDARCLLHSFGFEVQRGSE